MSDSRILRQMMRAAGFNEEAGWSQNIGLRNSHTPVDLLAVAPPKKIIPVEVLKGIGLPQGEENLGPATVHVAVRDASSRALGRSVPNQRIVLSVDWETGRAGGEADVDITHGAVFTMNANVVINAKATFVSNMLDREGLPVALVPGQDKHIEATVQWGGATFQPAYYPVGGIPLVGATPSVALPIPKQARNVMVFNDTPGVSVSLDFVEVPYGNLFPRGSIQPMPVVAGADTFKLTSSGNCNAIAIFELWL
jgi:hypothetical protein